jgi:hypothetical protein
MFLFYFVPIILIIGGVLGAAALIIKKKPSAAELIGKLTPWQGWIGVVMLIGGVWHLFWALSGALSIMLIITFVVEIVLGFLLGFSLIAKFAGEKGEKIFNAVSPFQGIFGIIAILLGIYWLLTWFGIWIFVF